MPPKGDLLKVRIGSDLKAEAIDLAIEQGETLSVVVRQALREYIDRHREKMLVYEAAGKSHPLPRVAEDPIIDDERAPGD